MRLSFAEIISFHDKNLGHTNFPHFYTKLDFAPVFNGRYIYNIILTTIEF